MNDERDPLELSRRLVYLAAERTLTSWIRAALSAMALGFVIDRFGLVLQLLPAASAHAHTHPRAVWAWSGSILIGMGTAMAFGAGVRYLRFAIAYHRERITRVRHGIVIGTLVSMLLGVFGVALIFLLTVILR